jgi:protein-tyrosine phosphatase
VSTVTERRIVLEGAVNFRDVGGYATEDGRSVAWRRLFRSDGLSQLTEGDHAVIESLGLRTVIDLRSKSEVERGTFDTARVPLDYRHVPILEEVPDAEAFILAPGMLGAQYLDMARTSSHRLGTVLGYLAADGALPAVVHCTAGKDRTGLVIALLLRLLGVPEETVVEDYAVSGEAMVQLRAKLIDRYPEGRETIEAADELFSADPGNLVGLLAMIGEEYGTVEDYAAAAGAGAGVVVALQDALLVDAPAPEARQP